jgi:hypothetical protein
MPEPKPREASGLRKVDEPHPVAPGTPSAASKEASKHSDPPDRLVSITHRVPVGIRERLKIAAVRLGRREQDVLAEALSRWLDEYEYETSLSGDHR